MDKPILYSILYLLVGVGVVGTRLIHSPKETWDNMRDGAIILGPILTAAIAAFGTIVGAVVWPLTLPELILRLAKKR